MHELDAGQAPPRGGRRGLDCPVWELETARGGGDKAIYGEVGGRPGRLVTARAEPNPLGPSDGRVPCSHHYGPNALRIRNDRRDGHTIRIRLKAYRCRVVPARRRVVADGRRGPAAGRAARTEDHGELVTCGGPGAACER